MDENMAAVELDFFCTCPSNSQETQKIFNTVNQVISFKLLVHQSKPSVERQKSITVS